jgi:hypothetical protein
MNHANQLPDDALRDRLLSRPIDTPGLAAPLSTDALHCSTIRAAEPPRLHGEAEPRHERNILPRHVFPLTNGFALIRIRTGTIFIIQHERPNQSQFTFHHQALDIQLGFGLKLDPLRRLAVVWSVETAVIEVYFHYSKHRIPNFTAARFAWN